MSTPRCTYASGLARCTLTTSHPTGYCYTHRHEAPSVGQLDLFGTAHTTPAPLAILNVSTADDLFDGPTTDVDEVLRRKQLEGLWISVALTRAFTASTTLGETIARASYGIVDASFTGDSRRWGRALEDALVLDDATVAAISAEAVAWCASTPGAPKLVSLVIEADGTERAVADLSAHATFESGTTRTYPVDLKCHDHLARDTTPHDLMSLSGILATATGDHAVRTNALSATDAYMNLAKGQSRLEPGADVWALVVARDHSSGAVAEIYVQSAFGSVTATGALGLATNPTRTQSVIMRRARDCIGADADPESALIRALTPATHDGRIQAALLGVLIEASGVLTATQRRELADVVHSIDGPLLAATLLGTHRPATLVDA